MMHVSQFTLNFGFKLSSLLTWAPLLLRRVGKRHRWPWRSKLHHSNKLNIKQGRNQPTYRRRRKRRRNFGKLSLLLLLSNTSSSTYFYSISLVCRNRKIIMYSFAVSGALRSGQSEKDSEKDWGLERVRNGDERDESIWIVRVLANRL